jgi:hypothetical protein
MRSTLGEHEGNMLGTKKKNPLKLRRKKNKAL